MRFNTGLKMLASLKAADQLTISREPQLYRADLNFAEKNGGPLMQEVLPHLDAQHPWFWNHVSIDVKTVMLQKGWYPCIPGWHLDDFWRPTGQQPAIGELYAHPSVHYMAIFGDCSLTEFLVSPKEMPVLMATGSKTVYGRYNDWIAWAGSRCVSVLPNRLYEFTCLDFHRGMPATSAGWRCFIRATFSDHREPRNQIRQQVQVYIPQTELEAGW